MAEDHVGERLSCPCSSPTVAAWPGAEPVALARSGIQYQSSECGRLAARDDGGSGVNRQPFPLKHVEVGVIPFDHKVLQSRGTVGLDTGLPCNRVYCCYSDELKNERRLY